MNRLKKVIETCAYGERTGRVAFVLKPETLPAAHAGLEWKEDKSFNPAEAVLTEPGEGSVRRHHQERSFNCETSGVLAWS
jgi:hypothetical protein